MQRPFYPEGRTVPHVYVLHPPGGIVGGDRLRINVDVADGAHALMTTPAATKIYRTAGARSVQELHATVGAAATLEWLPMENILFDQSAVDLVTKVELADTGRFIGFDMLCFGLPARNEGFTRGLCRQRFEIWREGRPILIERARFDGADPIHSTKAAWGLHGASILAMLVATPAPIGAGSLEALRAEAEVEVESALAPGSAGFAEQLGVTRLPDTETLVCRYLGHSPERARGFLRRMWARLRPLMLDRPAIAPRIWNT